MMLISIMTPRLKPIWWPATKTLEWLLDDSNFSVPYLNCWIPTHTDLLTSDVLILLTKPIIVWGCCDWHEPKHLLEEDGPCHKPGYFITIESFLIILGWLSPRGFTMTRSQDLKLNSPDYSHCPKIEPNGGFRKLGNHKNGWFLTESDQDFGWKLGGPLFGGFSK